MMAGVIKAAVVAGQAALKGLQHSEQNSILAFFNAFGSAFSGGALTILSYMKTTAIVTASVVPAIAVAYKVTGSGSGVISGSAMFVVPGPEAGTGISFVVGAVILGLVAHVRSRQSAV